jgi:hypothetical protein
MVLCSEPRLQTLGKSYKEILGVNLLTVCKLDHLVVIRKITAQ